LRAKRETARADGADLAEADLGDHALEAGALDAVCGRTTEIVIDHFDLRPAERCQAVAQGVLQRTARAIVQDLMSRGLPHMKQCLTLELAGSTLSEIMTGLSSLAWPCQLGRDLGSAAPLGWSARLASPPAGSARPVCPAVISATPCRTD
jgi:hypothetical protein